MKELTRDPLLYIILAWLAGQSALIMSFSNRLAVIEDRNQVAIRTRAISAVPRSTSVWAMPTLIPVDELTLLPKEKLP